MKCKAYRIYNGDLSDQTQSFDNCDGLACEITIPSDGNYFITADSDTFVNNPLLTIFEFEPILAYSFSSCCDDQVFHILGNTGIFSESPGKSICTTEFMSPLDCGISTSPTNGCYSFISSTIPELALGSQVYLNYNGYFEDGCVECLTLCVPCCRCYQVEVEGFDGCVLGYIDCETGLEVIETFIGSNNYVCSLGEPYGSGVCLSPFTITDLGSCSLTEQCKTCSETYCITNTGNLYDDTYNLDADYDGYQSWISSTGDYYIYYNITDKQWCLSSSLGGTCLLSGKSPCYSKCPDLCDEYFFEGTCPTTTTTTVACVTFDFDAIFDCMTEVTPTPTPTPTITPSMTPTPSSTSYCSMVSVDATISGYTPTPTPTPTITPTSSQIIVRPCNVLGDVSFTTLEGHIGCPSSKQFQDCVTGMMYYTTELVPTPSGDTLTEFMIFKAYVDGILKCVSFVGINDVTIGVNTIDLVEGPTGYSNLGECVLCDVISSPTPTPTPTMTPTPSGIPCFCYEIISETETAREYVDCNGVYSTISIDTPFTPYYVCSSAPLNHPDTINMSITKLELCSNGICPPLVCNCYIVSNDSTQGPVGLTTAKDVSTVAVNLGIYVTYYDCDNVEQTIYINQKEETQPFCSLTTPFVHSPIDPTIIQITTITLLGDCNSCSL
jgi:hypothetical protein